MRKSEPFNKPVMPGLHPSWAKKRNTSQARYAFKIEGKVWSLSEVMAHTGMTEEEFRAVFNAKGKQKSFSMQTLMDAANDGKV